MNYITNNDTIIFDCKFNNKFYIQLISAYAKLIFSSYKLNNKLFESYENNCFDGLKKKSIILIYLCQNYLK